MKQNRILTLSLSIGLCLWVTACNANNNSASTQEISEKNDTTATYPTSSVERVVALTSLSADMIHQLDSSKLVGIPGSRLLEGNPAFGSLPKISQGRTLPSLENIVALKPDLVIGAKGFHDEVLEKLNQLGIKTISSEVDSLSALEAFTRELATEVDGDASTLLARYQNCQRNASGPPKTVLMLVSHQPILAPNKNSWAGELLETFEFNNSVADLQNNSPMAGFVTLSEEKVLVTNPDIIIVVNVDPTTLENFKNKAFWSQLKATQNNQVFQAEYYGMVNPGSIESIETACNQLQKLSKS